jgi:hypothetical protein
MPGEERIWGNTEMKGARPFNQKFFRSNPKAQQEEEVSEDLAKLEFPESSTRGRSK